MGVLPVTEVIPVTARIAAENLLGFLKTLGGDGDSVHNIHFKFQISDIWEIMSRHPNYNHLVNSNSMDLILHRELIDDLKIQTIIHHTDTVTVSVACSKNPIFLDEKGRTRLSCALTRIEERLSRKLDECGNDLQGGYERIPIPENERWQVTMWHFGKDVVHAYRDSSYALTWGQGRELLRVYIKSADGQEIVRFERQEYPDLPLEVAIKEKPECDIASG
jgi:hypothetical protein